MEKAKAVFFVVQVAVSLVMVAAAGAFLMAPKAEWVGALETISMGCAAALVISILGQLAISSEQSRIAKEQAEIKRINEWYDLRQQWKLEWQAKRDAEWAKRMGITKQAK